MVDIEHMREYVKRMGICCGGVKGAHSVREVGSLEGAAVVPAHREDEEGKGGEGERVRDVGECGPGHKDKESLELGRFESDALRGRDNKEGMDEGQEGGTRAALVHGVLGDRRFYGKSAFELEKSV